MKSSKKKKSQGKNSGGGAQQFLMWHGEKFVVAVVAVIALWFAIQGLGYQTLSWQPSELESVANEAERAVRESKRSAEDEEIAVFRYDEYAEQIRSPIPAAPYRIKEPWNPGNIGQRSSATSVSQDY